LTDHMQFWEASFRIKYFNNPEFISKRLSFVQYNMYNMYNYTIT